MPTISLDAFYNDAVGRIDGSLKVATEDQILKRWDITMWDSDVAVYSDSAEYAAGLTFNMDYEHQFFMAVPLCEYESKSIEVVATLEFEPPGRTEVEKRLVAVR